MKPILFSKNETNFATNGLGRLDCLSCIVIEERNGMYELEAEIPISGSHAELLEMQSIIGVVPYEGGNVQAFVVYKIEKPISGRFKVYARHISYRLTDIPCLPFSVELSPYACADTLAGLKSHALEPCPFNFFTDITTASKYTQKVPASIRQRLGGVEGSVLDQFGGEYEWDNFDVHLWKQRGRLSNVSGISLRYGKNITDLNQEEQIAETVTGIVPYWIDSDGNNLVMLTEEPRVIYSDNAGNYPYHLTQVLDMSSNFENQPSELQLRMAAQQYVRKTGFGVPTVSIKVSFIDLWKSEEYKDIAPLERVQLCDEITVDFEKLGVKAIAKVVKTTYDVLKERYTEIEVGSIRSTLAQAITDRDAKIDSIYLDTVSKMSMIAQNATAWLTSANGYVVAIKNPDGSWKELLFMDTNDPVTATCGLRINNHGIGFWRKALDGGNVLDGPYTNAWTIDGNLVADFITTGVLKSQNYVAPTQASSPYAVSGMGLDMDDGTIHSEYFALTASGAYLRGIIEATGGHIGAVTITSTELKVIGDILLFYGGDTTFIFRPKEYNFSEPYLTLMFDSENGTSTVSIYYHDDRLGTDTLVETVQVSGYGARTTQEISSSVGIEGSYDFYYRITVTGNKTYIYADQTYLALIDRHGFHGVFQGVFQGRIESESGLLGNVPYSRGGFDADLRIEGDLNVRKSNGYRGNNSRIGITSGSGLSKPDVYRQYDENGNTVTEHLMWGSGGTYQNYIDQDILTPSGSATEGDLKFKGTAGTGNKQLYRYENNQWVETNLMNVTMSQTDITPGVTPLADGALYLVYE